MEVPLEDVHRGIEYMTLVFGFRPHDFVLFFLIPFTRCCAIFYSTKMIPVNYPAIF